eukprot:466771-Rhodomonas_salina.1
MHARSLREGRFNGRGSRLQLIRTHCDGDYLWYNRDRPVPVPSKTRPRHTPNIWRGLSCLCVAATGSERGGVRVGDEERGGRVA